MGMFDYVRCEVPLPDGYTGEFQTKDFDSFLRTILIRADGRLMIEDCDWEDVPLEERSHPDLPMLGAIRAINKRWRDLDFHGDFRFYDMRLPESWHEYLARFTHGTLERVVAIPESFYARSNMCSGRRQALDIDTLAVSAYADRITGGSHCQLTLGRKLGNLIAELPTDRRRQVEDRISALIAEEEARFANRIGD